MEFTQKQKLHIAEFMFGFLSETLINSDAENLIEVFKEHSVPEAYVANISEEDCLNLIKENINKEQLNDIMNEYFNGKL